MLKKILPNHLISTSLDLFCPRNFILFFESLLCLSCLHLTTIIISETTPRCHPEPFPLHSLLFYYSHNPISLFSLHLTALLDEDRTVAEENRLSAILDPAQSPMIAAAITKPTDKLGKLNTMNFLLHVILFNDFETVRMHLICRFRYH